MSFLRSSYQRLKGADRVERCYDIDAKKSYYQQGSIMRYSAENTSNIVLRKKSVVYVRESIQEYNYTRKDIKIQYFEKLIVSIDPNNIS
jgi:hypothetical protein